MATKADDWRKDNQREVTLKSGHAATIRKLMQRDFYPRTLVGLVIQGETEEVVREHLKRNPSELWEHEATILTKGVVSPRIPDELALEDLSQDERNELIALIADWSGLTKEADARVDGFRDAKLVDPGADGEVLRSAADGAARSDARGVQA